MGQAIYCSRCGQVTANTGPTCGSCGAIFEIPEAPFREPRLRALGWVAVAALFVTAVVVAVGLVVVGVASDRQTNVSPNVMPFGNSRGEDARISTTRASSPVNGERQIIDVAKTYTATIDTNFGDIEVRLDAKNAPIATNHFVTLVEAGYYDGLTWHRVIRDFMIQGGDKQGDGRGRPEASVVGELPQGAYPIGAIAAAKTAAAPFGEFGNQFFIVTGPSGVQLPPEYSTWGVVTKGLDVAIAISELGPVPSDHVDRPTQPALIEKITITES